MKKIVSVIIALSVTVTALTVIIDKLYKKAGGGAVACLVTPVPEGRGDTTG